MVVRPLPEGLVQIAKHELSETPERVKHDLQHLREWLAKQPHLNVRNEDQWLIFILRGCKFNLQKVKQKVDIFHTSKTLLPQYFSNRDPFSPQFQEILNNRAFYLVTNDKDFVGPRTVIINVGALNYDTIALDDLIILCIMALETLVLEDDNFVVSGFSLVIDWKGLNMNYLSQVTPSFIKRCVLLGSEATPLRIKNIMWINIPLILDNIVQICKIIAGDELKEKFWAFTESNYNKLYEHIPKNELPFEKGGECGNESDMAASIKKRIESYREWYIEDEKYCSDESKRIDMPKQVSNLFGIDGSFRKLDID